MDGRDIEEREKPHSPNIFAADGPSWSKKSKPPEGTPQQTPIPVDLFATSSLKSCDCLRGLFCQSF
jgi:hypothetical protein